MREDTEGSDSYVECSLSGVKQYIRKRNLYYQKSVW